ncbi:MAG: ABC transporter ATP-binding protein, partial [Thiotrichales bacterium]|nr:ABC transporter ATP-binding protein [Thiotrichales bacterium]
TEVLRGPTFSIRQGEIACLLGPSGTGKTTLLRVIAGFERPQSGEVRINGVICNDQHSQLPVEERGIGMVFQDFALFPHLSVEDNILFGLQAKSPAHRQQRLRQLCDLLRIADLLDKFPHQLSGGQQQRVAIARALAPGPRVMLLDEPFSNIDIELRGELAREIRTTLKEQGVTAIIVSHNQLESFAVADRIGVINEGRLLQWDTAFNIYHRPVDRYVADFVGRGVYIPATVINTTDVETELGMIRGSVAHGFSAGNGVEALIRPDDIIHDDASEMTALVEGKVFRGADFLYTLKLESGQKILSLVPSHHDHPVNQPIGIRVEIEHLVVFPMATRRD